MLKKTLLIFLIFLLHFSCKSSKVSTNENIANLSSKKIINNHYADNLKNKDIKARLTINYKGKTDLPELKGSLRIVKDSAIWISISKLGFPVGKLLVTPSRVKFYEKINKTFFDGDYSIISMLLGTDFDFYKVQNLFMGQALLNLKDQKYSSKIKQKKYLLIPKKKNPIFDMLFWIDPINFKIINEEFRFNDNKILKINYNNYTKINNLSFPGGFIIDAIGENRSTKINVDYKTVEQGSNLKTPFVIPENYKKLKLK